MEPFFTANWEGRNNSQSIFWLAWATSFPCYLLPTTCYARVIIDIESDFDGQDSNSKWTETTIACKSLNAHKCCRAKWSRLFHSDDAGPVKSNEEMNLPRNLVRRNRPKPREHKHSMTSCFWLAEFCRFARRLSTKRAPKRAQERATRINIRISKHNIYTGAMAASSRSGYLTKWFFEAKPQNLSWRCCLAREARPREGD